MIKKLLYVLLISCVFYQCTELEYTNKPLFSPVVLVNETKLVNDKCELNSNRIVKIRVNLNNTLFGSETNYTLQMVDRTTDCPKMTFTEKEIKYKENIKYISKVNNDVLTFVIPNMPAGVFSFDLIISDGYQTETKSFTIDAKKPVYDFSIKNLLQSETDSLEIERPRDFIISLDAPKEIKTKAQRGLSFSYSFKKGGGNLKFKNAPQKTKSDNQTINLGVSDMVVESTQYGDNQIEIVMVDEFGVEQKELISFKSKKPEYIVSAKTFQEYGIIGDDFVVSAEVDNLDHPTNKNFTFVYEIVDIETGKIERIEQEPKQKISASGEKINEPLTKDTLNIELKTTGSKYIRVTAKDKFDQNKQDEVETYVGENAVGNNTTNKVSGPLNTLIPFVVRANGNTSIIIETENNDKKITLSKTVTLNFSDLTEIEIFNNREEKITSEQIIALNTDYTFYAKSAEKKEHTFNVNLMYSTTNGKAYKTTTNEQIVSISSSVMNAEVGGIPTLSVPVNGDVSFSMTVSEDSYDGKFTCQFVQVNGSGKFSTPTQANISNNAKFDIINKSNINYKYRPLLAGEHEFHLIITDTNNQTTTKIIKLVAENTAINAEISGWSENAIINNRSTFKMKIVKENYEGDFECKFVQVNGSGKFSTPTQDNISHNNKFNIIANKEIEYNYIPSVAGKNEFTLEITDSYGTKTSKSLSLNCIDTPIKVETQGVNPNITTNKKNSFFLKIVKDSYLARDFKVRFFQYVGAGEVMFGTQKITSNREISIAKETNFEFSYTPAHTGEHKLQFNIYAEGDTTPTIYEVVYNVPVVVNGAVEPQGTATIEGLGTFVKGSLNTITIKPITGYSVEGLYNESTKIKNGETDKELSYLLPAENDIFLTAKTIKNKYQISAIASPILGGETSGTGSYEFNSTCELVATPKSGYNFIGWFKNGNLVNDNRTITVTVPANAEEYTAKFEKKSFNVYANVTPASSGTVEGAGKYEYGHTFTLTANAATNYEFVGWYSGSTQISTANPYTSTIGETNINLEAKFRLIKVVASGDVSYNAGSISGLGEYTYNQAISLYCQPAEGYKFLHWEFNGQTTSENPLNTKITKNTTYKAIVAKKTYTVSLVINNAKGSQNPTINYGSGVKPFTGEITVEHGTTVNLAANVASNTQLDGWYVNNSYAANSSNYSVLIKDNTSIELRTSYIKANINKNNPELQDGLTLSNVDSKFEQGLSTKIKNGISYSAPAGYKVGETLNLSYNGGNDKYAQHFKVIGWRVNGVTTTSSSITMTENMTIVPILQLQAVVIEMRQTVMPYQHSQSNCGDPKPGSSEEDVDTYECDICAGKRSTQFKTIYSVVHSNRAVNTTITLNNNARKNLNITNNTVWENCGLGYVGRKNFYIISASPVNGYPVLVK